MKLSKFIDEYKYEVFLDWYDLYQDEDEPLLEQVEAFETWGEAVAFAKKYGIVDGRYRYGEPYWGASFAGITAFGDSKEDAKRALASMSLY